MLPAQGIEQQLIEHLVLYRQLRAFIRPLPRWAEWRPYRPSPAPTDQPTEQELAVFRRNVELISELSSSRGAKTVLVMGAEGPAQPTVLDAVLRDVASARPTEVLLVDGDPDPASAIAVILSASLDAASEPKLKEGAVEAPPAASR